MGSLAGVAKVAYDCKTATVTMKEGGVIAREGAEAALKKAGFKMSSFKEGPQATVAAYVFRAEGLEPGKREAAAKGLADAIAGEEEVVLDGGGVAVLTMKPGKATSEEAIARALEAQGLRLSEFVRKDWPASNVAYLGRVERMGDAATREAVREALRGLEKVIAAQAFEDSGAIRLRLHEPCEKIEASVRAALEAKGYALARFEKKP